MTNYEKIISDLGQDSIKRTNEDGLITWIPIDPANSDYQEYLNHEATAE